jgi:hypothetical protein
MKRMEILRTIGTYLQEHILSNPILWGIAAVILWIAGSAFIKALRGKDADEDG